jgi:dienelactone hydrolase
MRFIAVAVVLAANSTGRADDPARLLPAGKRSTDERLSNKPRDLNGNFPFEPPADLPAWNRRRADLKVQLQVALGLWPMPERGPVNAVVHGAIDRDEYTVAKVHFASLPGHYVTGNLYRPKSAGRRAAVLCPHGHWAGGRLQDIGDKAVAAEIAAGAETWPENARYHLQAKCAHLARMGCVVFHYDMIGYADSRALGHGEGFSDAESTLWLHSAMGLQSWNSLRALDFVCELPDVDATRVGCTGGSGGGTQTFILAALDERLAAAFPAVMVSTGMQGGCACENAPGLRVGTGNVEIAALLAPKPLGMTGANDWTRDIETKGLPELEALYALYGRPDDVMAKCFPRFGHNYNQVSREVMYDFFNRHLKLGATAKERPFTSVPPDELRVFDGRHPRPADEADAAGVRTALGARARAGLATITPSSGPAWRDGNGPLRQAVRAILHTDLPRADQLATRPAGAGRDVHGLTLQPLWLGRVGRREAVPACEVRGPAFDGTVVVWVHPAGKASLFAVGRPQPALETLVRRGAAVLAVDVFDTGEQAAAPIRVDARYPGFTFGYNRARLAERVHDILTAVAAARARAGVTRVWLVGWGSAGPWVVMARSLAGDAVERTAADLDGFRFDAVRSNADPMMLPGALRYGGLATFAALSAPHALLLHNHQGTGTGKLVQDAYRAGNAIDRLRRVPDRLADGEVVDWLTTAK